MKNKTLLIVVLIIVFAGVGLYFVQKQNTSQIPVMAEYDEKVVYTTDLSVATEALIGDCNARNGKFNECGTPCGPEEEFCTAVCAYTCEF